MNRAQLEHAIRTACELTMKDRVFVVGSQSILGSFDADDLPPEATGSGEVDMLPDGVDHDEIERLADLIEGIAGEVSCYDDLHGFSTGSTTQPPSFRAAGETGWSAYRGGLRRAS